MVRSQNQPPPVDYFAKIFEKSFLKPLVWVTAQNPISTHAPRATYDFFSVSPLIVSYIIMPRQFDNLFYFRLFCQNIQRRIR